MWIYVEEASTRQVVAVKSILMAANDRDIWTINSGGNGESNYIVFQVRPLENGATAHHGRDGDPVQQNLRWNFSSFHQRTFGF